jgi:hypothetical protein
LFGSNELKFLSPYAYVYHNQIDYLDVFGRPPCQLRSDQAKHLIHPVEARAQALGAIFDRREDSHEFGEIIFVEDCVQLISDPGE